MSAHLTPDEILERVFPEEGGPAAVPGHLASCAVCQERVARLREAWLLDRGAVAGFVDGLPPSFWTQQSARTMEAVRAAAGVREPARVRRGLARHPVLALSSLAAALLLAATVFLTRASTAPPPTQSAAVERPTASPADASDEELLRAIDRVLDESSLAHVVPEDVL